VTITIRLQGPEDEAAVRGVLTAAFKDDGRVAALAEALRGRHEPGAALVAVDGNNIIVGYTQLSLSWVDARERLVEVLVLSPLAVAPTHQCQGIGSSLLTAARQEAERLKAPLLFLEGDPRYYSRHGWRPAGELGFCPPSARIPSLAFQVVTLPGYDPTTMRGALVYNDTFWSHDCVGLRGARLDRWSRAGSNEPTHPA
jgi:putative acetyltransferase